MLGSYCGDPGKTRTSDLRFRKPSLYPAELRDRGYRPSIFSRDIASRPGATAAWTPQGIFDLEPGSVWLRQKAGGRLIHGHGAAGVPTEPTSRDLRD